jgi:hypothetical protein
MCPAHSPCSRLHAHPAGRVATAAGGLLPHRFAPYPVPEDTGGILFCCGCSQDAALAGLPPLIVSWGNLAPPPRGRQGRESGSSSEQLAAQRRLTHWPGTIVPRPGLGVKAPRLDHTRCVLFLQWLLWHQSPRALAGAFHSVPRRNRFGVRRSGGALVCSGPEEQRRHAKAPSPLRSAGALQKTPKQGASASTTPVQPPRRRVLSDPV